MAGYSDDHDRQVIPRWRGFKETILRGELSFPRLDTNEKELGIERYDFLTEKLTAFKTNRRIPFAADLVGSAFVLDRIPEVQDAINFLTENKEQLTPQLRTFVQDISTGVPDNSFDGESVSAIENEALRDQVRFFRDFVRREPYDAISWVELSRAYTLLAQKDKAARAMDIAVRLSPENRFVLRSASRLFVHLDDLDQAHEILLRSDAHRHDPWILSAEIAIAEAAAKTSREKRRGLQVLSGGKFSPHDVAELGGALGTIELSHGNQKKGRRLLSDALREPTENVLAQIAWLERLDVGLKVPRRALALERAFEARAWDLTVSQEWRGTLDACHEWQRDQPFSSRPAVHGSYVAAMALRDFDRAIDLAKDGLKCNPNHFTLLNNLAFAEASAGNIESALDTFDAIEVERLDGDERIVYMATAGLLSFRAGLFDNGRRLYRAAIDAAKKAGQKRVAALAAILYAIEEMRVDSDFGDLTSKEAHALLKGVKLPEAQALLDELSERKLSFDSRVISPEPAHRLQRILPRDTEDLS